MPDFRLCVRQALPPPDSGEPVAEVGLLISVGLRLLKLLTEMPEFEVPKRRGTLRDKDGRAFKDMTMEEIDPNMLLTYSERATFMTPPGFFVLEFLASEDMVGETMSGNRHPVVIPSGSPIGMRPFFATLWNKPQTKGILGIIQGQVTDEVIFIDFMAVRAAARRNSVNTKMIETLKAHFEGRGVSTSDRTKEGDEFWKDYMDKDPDAIKRPDVM